MVQPLPGGYVYDPSDPRAPSLEQWARMTPAERARVVELLCSDVPIESAPPPEGDPHRRAKERALDALERFFRGHERRIYVSSELAVLYPGERRFVPDLLAVLDVDPHERMQWVVVDEGKGLDFVLEVHVAGDMTKDYARNVEWYARLGIQEYFVFDRGRQRLLGHRLPAARALGARGALGYERIVPQGGHFESRVLGLRLALEGPRLRFFYRSAPLEEADDLIVRLETALDGVIARKEEAERQAEVLLAELAEERRLRQEAERLREEERRLREEERRLREEERRLREEAELRLVELRAELERRGGR